MRRVEVRPDKLPRADGIELARVSGVASRYGNGTMRTADRDVALAAVHAVSTDRVLLGIAAGHALVDPHGINGAVVDLLRTAGADMEVAAAAEAELRARRAAQGARHRD